MSSIEKLRLRVLNYPVLYTKSYGHRILILEKKIIQTFPKDVRGGHIGQATKYIWILVASLWPEDMSHIKFDTNLSLDLEKTYLKWSTMSDLDQSLKNDLGIRY